MKQLVIRVGAVVLALSALGFVVVNAGLSGSCARSQPAVTPGAQSNGGATNAAVPSVRLLPATKWAPAIMPGDPRYLPATKAAPVFLPRPARNAPPPAQQAPTPQGPSEPQSAP